VQLLDRYLQALRIFLPRDKREDILKELSEDIRSEAEEQEAALGRSLNEAEQTAIVRRIGHPLMVASRYTRPGHLIGPVIFPLYRLFLIVGVALTLLSQIAGTAAAALAGPAIDAVADLWPELLGSLLLLFAGTTLVFGAIDRFLTSSRIFETWDPRRMPPVIQRPRRASGSIWQLVVSAAASVWFIVGLSYPALLIGPAAEVVDWSPDLRGLRVFFGLMVVASLAREYFSVTVPHRLGLQLSLRLIAILGVIPIVYFVVIGADWMVATSALNSDVAAAVALTNRILSVVLTVAAAVVVLETTVDLTRFLQQPTPIEAGRL
jgi:hypothetical protein